MKIYESICAMCAVNGFGLKAIWLIIGMHILMNEIFIVINAIKNLNRHIFYEHIKIPFIRIIIDTNAKRAAENLNETII